MAHVLMSKYITVHRVVTGTLMSKRITVHWWLLEHYHKCTQKQTGSPALEKVLQGLRSQQRGSLSLPPGGGKGLWREGNESLGGASSRAVDVLQRTKAELKSGGTP